MANTVQSVNVTRQGWRIRGLRQGRYTQKISRMFNPSHQEEALRQDVLPALGLSVTGVAIQLGVTRTAFSRVVNGLAAAPLEMTRCIEAWLGPVRGGRAKMWPGMQMALDL